MIDEAILELLGIKKGTPIEPFDFAAVCKEDHENHFLAHATALKFPNGGWPMAVMSKDGGKFRLTEMAGCEDCGEPLGAVYREHEGLRTILVLNDHSHEFKEPPKGALKGLFGGAPNAKTFH